MTTKDEHGKDEKLFERAIVQSASLVKPVSKENNLIMAREIFANAGWPESSTFDSPAAVAWLRNQSADTIINSIDGFGMHRTRLSSLFAFLTILRNEGIGLNGLNETK